MAKSKNILLGVTGSIAAYRSADIARRLMETGYDVSVIMTESAQKFIGELTLSSLTGKKAYSGWFDDDSSFKMHHIELAKTADLVLIAPATANSIAKLAYGLADDLLSATVLGTKAPVCIAPAMNTEMYKNPIVQENCQKLIKHGMRFIDPIKGKLACGVNDDGHIADTETIIKKVKALLK